jgi:ABC-type transporter Mla maintaining outer membrane lipid asymmetry ATPase subunit MlaF
MNPTPAEPAIQVKDLTMAYGDQVVMRDLNFEIRRGDIFIIMGGSGCGKSTLMRHLRAGKSFTAAAISPGPTATRATRCCGASA